LVAAPKLRRSPFLLLLPGPLELIGGESPNDLAMPYIWIQILNSITAYISERREYL